MKSLKLTLTIEIDEDLVKLINDSNKFTTREEMASDNQLMAGFGRAIGFRLRIKIRLKFCQSRKLM